MNRYHLISAAIAFILLVIGDVDGCETVDRKWRGARLICCGSASPATFAAQFSFCDRNCTCQFSFDEYYKCSSEAIHTNDSFLPCSDFQLPNSQEEFEVRVGKWSNSSAETLQQICDYKVKLLRIDSFDSTDLTDIASCFPQLEIFEIKLRKRQKVDFGSSIHSLTQLKILRLTNVDFEFEHKHPSWTRTIEQLHIENSSLTDLPRWLASAHRLARLYITKTKLVSLATISQLTGLKSAQISHNEIDDAHRFVISGKQLNDLDLSHNQISAIGSHTFASVTQLKALNLAHNPLRQLPYKPFVRNSNLKWLTLADTHLKELTAEHFAGLSSLKSLSLSRTPLASVSPFAFLPLKNLRNLDLSSTNLTRLPPAVTQNCALTHLNLANNLFHRRSSLPPEVLALLSSLSHFRIDGNPLVEFPSSLLLISTNNVKLMRQLILTSTTLPFWTSEPCTPYYWHMHVANKSSTLRQLVAAWNATRMDHEGLVHCREQYSWMIDQLEIYRDLESSSGCAATRRLRSAMLRNAVSSQPCNSTASAQNSTTRTIVLSRASQVSENLASPILIISLLANFCFICLILGFICLILCCRKPQY